jgi:hypothetical protein
MRWIFSAALLLSAALLFTLQPMVAKMLLPILGGTPAVWNTCMVFFQVGLLAGYAYAHLLCGRLRIRAQVALHAALVLLSLAALPVAVSGRGAPPVDANPIPWVLVTLAVACGLPFVVVAATSPLLQRWFATTGSAGSRDPYFLYAASNLGSLGGLLAYPVLLEPALPLASSASGGMSQSRLWTIGYAAFSAVVIGCGALALLRGGRDAGAAEAPAADPAPTPRQVARWMLLAFVPSSLLLGATQFITAEVAAIPLLWAVPLALYLLTFVAAFGGGDRVPVAWVSWTFAALATAAAVLATFGPDEFPWSLTLVAHLLLLTAAALMCHLTLARLRPAAGRLTGFYLAIAAGGALGGVFNALVAPVLFRDILEYPLMVLVACALRPAPGAAAGSRPVWPRRALDVAVPLALAAYLALAARFAPRHPAPRETLALLLGIGLPAAIVLATAGRRVRFALAFAVLLGFFWIWHREGSVLRRERSFFAVHRATVYKGTPFKFDDAGGLTVRLTFHGLQHGSTRHGVQAVEGIYGKAPTTYYHRTGPIGQVFAAWGNSPLLDEVGVVGLGCGTLAAYGSPRRRFTMHEIDPAVVRIATDPALFTYLEDTSSPWRVVLGDGRRTIEQVPDGTYGLLVLDAFTSDAVPVHLLTREAMATYVRKLRPGGLVALNLTNGYLDLEKVVGAIASDLGLAALLEVDDDVDARAEGEGKDPSVWAIVARSRADLEPLATDPRWKPLAGDGAPPPLSSALWTDQYSNLFSVLSP